MSEIVRETLETDILIVGAGPAGLSLAHRLRQLLAAAKNESPQIMVIEKGKYPGAHSLSGAVLDPRALAELIPDYLSKEAPLDSPVTSDAFYYLSSQSAFQSPILPPPLQNHGNYIISLNKFTSWLAAQAEAAGVEIYSGLAGFQLLTEGDSVVGVQTVDLGLNKDGTPGPKFEPGTNIRARVTILCEGVHGSLTRQAFEAFSVLRQDRLPQSYLTGVKEVWQVQPNRIKPGEVIHTIGYPQSSDQYGGGWVYGMQNNLVSVGYCVGLDSPDPTNDPHGAFQRYKNHKLIRSILDGGTMLHYGAKAVPVGGYFSMPRLSHGGLMLCGDSAGFLNGQRLKGIHLAIKSGMLAAEALAEAITAGDFSAERLARYDQLFAASWAREELHKVRNFHASFKGGLFAGLFHGAIQQLTGGAGIFERREHRPDHAYMKRIGEGGSSPKAGITFDQTLTFDKVSDVYKSGTMHDEHQPSHLVIADYDICNTRCTQEYGNPCQHFCPASVYNMVDDSERPGRQKLQLTPSNCVHCKTCDIADPYQVIRWVTPQGGEGPNYTNL